MVHILMPPNQDTDKFQYSFILSFLFETIQNRGLEFESKMGCESNWPLYELSSRDQHFLTCFSNF